MDCTDNKQAAFDEQLSSGGFLFLVCNINDIGNLAYYLYQQ